MQKYSWKGIDKEGKKYKGIVNAKTFEQIKTDLLKQNIAILSARKKRSFSRNRINTTELNYFFHDLSIILSSGISLVKALEITIDYNKSKKLKNIIASIITKIEQGSAFSDAISKQKNYFSPLMIQVVKSGEQSGNLATALKNLNSYLDKKENFVKKLKQASLTPLITILFSMGIIIGLFIFVIPQLKPIFESVKDSLPTSTKTILLISDFFGSETTRIIILTFLIMFFIAIKTTKRLFFLKKIIFFDKTILYIPFIKNFVITSNLAKLSQTLSFLLKSGDQLRPSLLLARKVCTNKILEKQFFDVAQNIDRGKSLREAFGSINSSYLPTFFLNSISIGQESGKLEIMLDKTADLLEEKLDNQIHFICSIFQPALIILLGIFIAFIMLSIYIPLFNIASVV